MPYKFLATATKKRKINFTVSKMTLQNKVLSVPILSDSLFKNGASRP